MLVVTTSFMQLVLSLRSCENGRITLHRVLVLSVVTITCRRFGLTLDIDTFVVTRLTRISPRAVTCLVLRCSIVRVTLRFTTVVSVLAPCVTGMTLAQIVTPLFGR